MTGDPKVLKFSEDKKDGEEEEGALCDVAPTILDIMVSDARLRSAIQPVSRPTRTIGPTEARRYALSCHLHDACSKNHSAEMSGRSLLANA